MNLVRTILAISFSVFAFAAANAKELAPSSDESFRKIEAFVDAAPRTTEKCDLAYAIKISERDRIWVCHKCKELLALDPNSKDAVGLYYKLQAGEGPQEVIASYLDNNGPSQEKIDRRIREVLSSHLIVSVSVGSLGMSVNVETSHADRARYLLAQVILNEKLQISLSKPANGGTHWVEVKPEEALQSYSE